MLFDSIKMVEGSEISNLTVAYGSTFPDIPDLGEMFYITDSAYASGVGLYIYNGTNWVLQINNEADFSALLQDNTVPGTFTSVTVSAKGLVTSGTHPTTLAGYGITDAQPKDDDLSAIAALSGNLGLLKKTAANTWTLDTGTYLTSNQTITISGDATGSGTSAITLVLGNTGVAAGTYGSASAIPMVAVDAKGRVTSVINTTPSLDTSTITSGTFVNARIAQSNVTQHQAALSINETQIPDGTIFARVGANETVTGTWTFGHTVAGQTPTSGSHLTTKDYVDNVAAGVSPHLAVLTSTTANIALSGLQTLDGVTVNVGDRVLVKDQTNGAENGVYVVAAGAWARAIDFDGSPTNEVAAGDLVYVETGLTNGNSSWILVTYGTITVGSTPLMFSVFSRPGDFVAGNGLTKSANTFNVGTVSSGRIVVNADTIDLAQTGVTAGTYSSLTVDTYGRVTAASTSQSWTSVTGAPTTLAGYGITDAQPLDNDLTAIAALSTTGLIVRTATGTATTRSMAVAGNGLTISNPNGVTGDITITSNAVSANTPSTLVSRDTSGNFAAGTITATLTGNADTATTLQTARAISLGGDITGTVNFNGGSDVAITATLPTVNANIGTFGSSSLIPVVTVNAKGLVTGVSTTEIVSGVSSVAGKTGVVTLVKGDVGLGNVDNTADSAKSVNYATTAGTASTANALATARTINGVLFDGTANITFDAYTLPMASAGALGGIKVGNGLAIDANGVLSAASAASATNISQGVNTADEVVLTSSTGTGTNIAAATHSVAGVMSASDKIKLDNLSGFEISVISSNTQAVSGKTYVFEASCVLTLPANPSVNQYIGFSNRSGTLTCQIAANGSKIMGVVDNLLLDTFVTSYGRLVYTGSNSGWIFI